MRAGWWLPLWLLALGTPAFAQVELPVYPGVTHTRIGGELMIGGHPHRLAYFTTKDSLQTVADYFFKQWKEEGYPTFEDGDMQQEGIVSAFLTREGVEKAVVLRKHGEVTLAFTVLRDYWIRESPRKSDGKLLRLEGSIFSGDFGSDDGQGTSKQRTQIVPGQLAAVRSVVLERMKLEGMTLMRETGQKVEGHEQLVLEHSSPGQQVVTVLSPVEGQYVAVHQTWIGSDRPDAVPNDVAVKALRERMKKEQGK